MITIHDLIKNVIKDGLESAGWNAETEFTTKEGRVDVHAVNKKGEELNIEVINTNIQNWVLVKMGLVTENNIDRNGKIRISLKIGGKLWKKAKMEALRRDIDVQVLVEEGLQMIINSK